MNINKAISGINAYYSTAEKNSSKKSKWKLTDSLKERVTQMAKEDAEKGTYMGKAFQNLRKSEVAGVSPDRTALMGKMNSSIYGDMSNMRKIEEADRRYICMLFGEPYEAEFQSEGVGSAVHVYDENGDEILTYTGGVGWHEKPSRSETEVHQTLKAVYYEAYSSARKELKTNSIASGGKLNISI